MKSTQSPIRRASLGIALGLTMGLFVLALGVEAQTRAGGNASDFIPRASIIEIMDAMVMSSADVLWNAVSVSVTEAGIVESRPETDEDWARLRWSAITMAEATNAILIPGRHVAPEGAPAPDPSDPSLKPAEIESLINSNWAAWAGHAHVLEAAAQEAIAAIDAKDVDKLTDVGGTIDAACESCHLQFWYPEQ